MTKSLDGELARADAVADERGTNGARPGSTPAPAVTGPPATGWGLPLAVLIVGMFMSVLDISIICSS